MKPSAARALSFVVASLVVAIVLLSANTAGLTIQGSDAVVREVVVPESSLSVVERSPDLSLAAREAQINPEILVKTIETAAKLTEAICTLVAPTGPAGVAGCVAIGAIAIFGIFFLTYRSSGRDLTEAYLLTDYPPIPGCGTRCRLNTDAPEGGYRLIGNATVNGVFHTIHFSRNGTISGLRSFQFNSVPGDLSARQQEDDYGGVVTEYLWDNGNEKAYDSFDSYSQEVTDFGYDATNDLVEANSILECASFADSDGVLAPGLLAVGWNNQPYEFDEPGESASLLSYCQSSNSE